MRAIKDNTKERFYTKCKTCESKIEYEYNDVNFRKVGYSYSPKTIMWY